MNVMITNLSLINGNKKNKEGEQLKSYKYEYKDEGEKEYTIEAIQTNEAATKFYIEWLRNRNEHLDKIVYLASEEVRVNKRIIEKGDKTFWTINEETENGITTEEYYKNIIQDFAGNDKLEFIAVDYGSDGITSSLDEIAKNLEEGDVVYLDTTGGKRDYGNSLQLLVKFLNYKGVTVKMPLYCDMNFQSGVGAIKIVDTYDLLEVLDGVNQFVTTGQSNILQNVFQKGNYTSIKKILENMNEFTDYISLCKVDEIDTVLRDLAAQLNNFVIKESDDIKLVIFNHMIEIIRKKFFIDDNNDVLSVIKWCLANNLIQQAFTLCCEKIPKYLFDKKMFEYTGKCEYKSYNSTEEQKAVDKLYSGILAELKDIHNDIGTNIKNIYMVNKEEFEKYYKNNSYKIKWAVFEDLDCGIKKKIIYNEKSNDNLLIENKELQDKTLNLFNKIKEQYPKFGGITNYFNSTDKINKEFGVITENKKNSLESKIKLVDKLPYWAAIYSDCFEVFCGFNANFKKDNIEKVQKVLYGYIYVKGMRNIINHALTQGDFNEYVNEKYNKMGFKGFDKESPIDKPVLSIIKENLNIFINDLEDILLEMKEA